MLQPNSSPWKRISSTLRSSDYYSPTKKTPEKCQQKAELSANGSPLPSTFRFTPTKGKKLYPHLNPPDRRLLPNSSPSYSDNNDHDESYMVKDNTSFLSAMDTLGKQLFSSNISNKVVNEFSSRYEKVREESISTVQELNNRTTNEQLNRRASGRFSSTHRNRFNRMESIAFHYAAKRSQKLENEKNENEITNSGAKKENHNVQRKFVPATETIEITQYSTLTPGDKRFNSKPLESASKRLRLEGNKFKEIDLDSSPTKSLYEREQLKNIYSTHSSATRDSSSSHPGVSNIPSYLQPTKASLRKSNSSSQISPSKSSKSLFNALGDQLKTPVLRPQDASLKKGLSKSPSFSQPNPLPGATSQNSSPMQKISPSRACSNLNKLLNTPPPLEAQENRPLEVPQLKSTTNSHANVNSLHTKIPRSRTLGPIYNDSTFIPSSKTSKISTSKSHVSSVSVNNLRSLSGSSSIPRLARLANAESRVGLASKHEREKPLKPWR